MQTNCKKMPELSDKNIQLSFYIFCLVAETIYHNSMPCFTENSLYTFLSCNLHDFSRHWHSLKNKFAVQGNFQPALNRCSVSSILYVIEQSVPPKNWHIFRHLVDFWWQINCWLLTALGLLLKPWIEFLQCCIPAHKLLDWQRCGTKIKSALWV